jgi:hypothetical protein
VRDESEDDTENVFDADCCNGIVAVMVVVMPFCGERSDGDDMDGKGDADGRDAAIDAGAFCVSVGADCASNSGGGTCVQRTFYKLVNRYEDHVMPRALGVACTLVMSLARSQ